MTQKIREQYFAAVLQQNIGFFDNLGAGEITTTITTNMDLVLSGVSEKVALVLSAFATFVTALLVGFVKNWRLSLILLSVVFAVVFVMGGFSIFIVRYNKRSLDAYAIGGAIAEEAISSIRTATAFNGQAQLAKRYEESLLNSMHWGFKMKVAIGCMIASMMLVVYMDYGLSFWQGSRLLVAGDTNLADTLTVLLALMMGAVSVAHVAPHAQAFTAAVAAARSIFNIIDRPLPNSLGSEALIPEDIQGSLELRNVKHIYPSRPEVTVMQDANLLIPAGKVTALVGASGSGKSTIVGLVERFYTPVGGQIFLDNHDIHTLDLKWLRRQMSLVSQEPVLFNCSIRRNIEHGLIGTEFEEAGKEKKAGLVVQAAKMANAHDFINRLSNGYETVAGDHGVLLSGGQKQRIAIARAVISNPKILLLDEATSALDSESERVVQAALDVAAQGRTTIVIAHRLSTIKGADKIVVLSRGRIAEQGTHEELLSHKGAYFDLLEAQHITADKETATSNGTQGEDISSAKEVVDADLSGDLAKGPRNHEPRKSTSAVSIALKNSPREGLHDSLWTIIKAISAFNKRETGIMIFGLVCSILAGGGMPVQGVLFAKCIISLSLPPAQYPQLRTDINFWSLMYLTVALAVFLVSAAHGIAFGYCSERL
jgi:ATP-binding cassette, subfamily B (MDR/TAP), member 1